MESNTLAVPVRRDADGEYRVGGSRLTLAVLLAEYWEGATPEQIAETFPSLSLPSVYALIGWYLSNRDAADTYLRQHAMDADRLRQQFEADPTNRKLRERLVERRGAQRK